MELIRETAPFFSDLIHVLIILQNRDVSPIHAPSFKGLAPALVMTAEMDPLRDEGAAYAKKLKDAGVEVEHVMIPGMPHTVALLDDICEGGRQHNALITTALKRAFKVST